VAAVEEGRVIFDNIRKFVFYLFSCNLAEILVLLLAGVFGLPLPLLPLQILWLNMVTDTFPALALAVEPGDHNVMDRPPRDPQEAILSHTFLKEVVFYSVLITASTLAAFVWGLSRLETSATSMAFMTLALAQILHLGNARSGRAVLDPRAVLSNCYALGAVLLSIMLQLGAIHIEPLADVLRVSPFTAEEWIVVMGCAVMPAVVGQVLKSRRAEGNDAPHETRRA
jgi:Ca2+-transporting ATPase